MTCEDWFRSFGVCGKEKQRTHIHILTNRSYLRKFEWRTTNPVQTSLRVQRARQSCGTIRSWLRRVVVAPREIQFDLFVSDLTSDQPNSAEV